MKTLLKGGKIYDGSGAAPFVGDILLNGDKISEVAESIPEEKADKVMDLKGKGVAPGFIDMHSHNDWFAIKKEPLPYFDPFIRQGITSFITGNCGLSAIGFDKDSEHVDKIGGGLFRYGEDTTGVYGTAKEFLDAVDRKMPCNMGILVGHCSARAGITGYEGRLLNDDETERMLAAIEENLQCGALGASLGMMYNPGLYADVDELKKIAQLCVKYDKPLTVHPRAESVVSLGYPEIIGRSHLLRALDELAEVAEGTDLKLQYSHAIFVGRRSFGDKKEFLKIINRMRNDGIRVQFDIYNELKGVSVITVALPGWYQGMSEAERNKRSTKIKLDALITATSKLIGFTFDDIEIAYIGPGYEKYEGKTVHQIAEEEGMKELDAYLMLCKLSDFRGRVNMGPYTTKKIIRDFEKNDLCLYMTDAWVEPHGIQNPAIYDCFPKFLQDSLRGLGDTMPNTIRRMTGATADRFELKNRGYIKKGYYADITVFDEGELRSTEADKTKSFGINKVLINGKLVLDDGKLDRRALKTSGRAIRG